MEVKEQQHINRVQTNFTPAKIKIIYFLKGVAKL